MLSRYQNVRLNPLVGFSINSSSADTFSVHNAETGKTCLISSECLLVLKYCCKEREFEHCSRKIMKDCKFTSQEAIFYMFDLLEKKILVHPFEYRNISSRYKLWFFYGWWMPLYYLLSSQSNNLNLEDKDNHQSHKVSLKGKAANKLVFYKKYEKSEHVVLPKPFRLPQASLGKVLLSRRTARDFFNPMTIQELSNVLFWSFCKVKEYRDLQQSTTRLAQKTLWFLYLQSKRFISLP